MNSKEAQETAAKHRRVLRKLTETVTEHLALLDIIMTLPSIYERGRKIAALSNSLEMANDSVRYDILGINFRTDKKPARRRVQIRNEIERRENASRSD